MGQKGFFDVERRLEAIRKSPPRSSKLAAFDLLAFAHRSANLRGPTGDSTTGRVVSPGAPSRSGQTASAGVEGRARIR
jgi:hypothetical protein